MKIHTTGAQISAALAVAARSVGNGKTQAILGHVLLEATPDGGITISATDLRTRSWHTVEAKVEQAGAVTLPPKAIEDFLDAVPSEDAVSLTVDAAHKARLVCGPTTVRVAGLDPDGFPAPPQRDDVVAELHLTPDALRSLVESVAFAAWSKEDNRPGLAGVHITTRDGRLLFEAADGLRVARRALDYEDAPEIDVIVPASPLAKVIGGLPGAKGDIRLVMTASHLLIDADAGQAAITRIEADFPDINRILPKEITAQASVDRAVLSRALRLVRNLEKIETGHRVDLSITADAIGLSASDRSSDHAASTTIAATLQGEPVEIALNATHLSAAIDALDDRTVVLSIQSPRHPVLVSGVDDGDRRHVHVLVAIVARSS